MSDEARRRAEELGAIVEDGLDLNDGRVMSAWRDLNQYWADAVAQLNKAEAQVRALRAQIEKNDEEIFQLDMKCQQAVRAERERLTPRSKR